MADAEVLQAKLSSQPNPNRKFLLAIENEFASLHSRFMNFRLPLICISKHPLTSPFLSLGRGDLKEN